MRNIRVFRYDPSQPAEERFDSFRLEIPNEATTTILDVLLRLLQEQDATLAFRFACRVNMCGSCGMVVNGTERLACKTNVSDIAAGNEITIRPLNHFPVIKDLVVDMEPFFEKYDAVLPFFEAKQASAEPALIRPDSVERLDIAGATDCIACGCCVSSCTMTQHHGGYAGPAALNRAFTLLADSRDGLFEERLDRALESCHQCRSELNCTEVCPKGISPTWAIKYIQRLALTRQRPAKPKNRVPVLAGAAGVAALAVLAYFAPQWGSMGALAAVLVGVALLLVAPFLFKAGQHPLANAAGVACVIGILYWTVTAFASTQPYGRIIPVPDRQLTASETRGLRLFATMQCAFCHQIDGMGGHRTGPDLSNIAAKKRTRNELVSFIRNPGTSRMPGYKLPDADLEALADFVLALDFGKVPAKIVKSEEVLKHE
jgi:succinate dehydrogenase/fumarate reductase iron-sulfur protein